MTKFKNISISSPLRKQLDAEYNLWGSLEFKNTEEFRGGAFRRLEHLMMVVESYNRMIKKVGDELLVVIKYLEEK